MKKFIPILAIILASYAEAKILYVDVFLGDTYIRRPITVDPRLKIWRIRNFIYQYFDLDPAKYVMARETIDGLLGLNPANQSGCYGDNTGASVGLKVIQKKYVPKEEPVVDGSGRCE